MGRKSKSKRFTAQGKNSVEKHAERFPYRSTFAEAEAEQHPNRADSFPGGAE